MDTAQWVSIHIRDRLEKGEISIKDAFLYEYVPPLTNTSANREDEEEKGQTAMNIY